MNEANFRQKQSPGTAGILKVPSIRRIRDDVVLPVRNDNPLDYTLTSHLISDLNLVSSLMIVCLLVIRIETKV